MRLIVCTLAVLALSGCSEETARQAETCAVYRAFYDYWPERARPQLRFVRQARPHIVVGTAAVDQFEPGFIRDPNNMHPPEFSEDTSTYFEQLGSEAVTISDCFRDGGPTFIDELERQDTWWADDDIIVFVLSPVALAPDGEHALLLTTTPGGESYVLFEHQRSEWILKGNAAGQVF